jgi:hypothetical protein
LTASYQLLITYPLVHHSFDRFAAKASSSKMASTFSATKSLDSIVKLTGPENLHQWKENFKALAQLHRLWMHYDGSGDHKYANKPQLTSTTYDLYSDVKFEGTSTLPTSLNERYNIIQYNEDLKEWKLYQSRIKEAWDFIKLSVEQHLLNYANNYSQPSEYYRWLIRCNSVNTHVRLHFLYEQFSRTSLEKDQSIQQYANKLNELNARIIAAGGKLENDQVKARILSGLPKSYQHFRTAYYMLNQDISASDLIHLLVQEEQSKRLQGLDKKEEKVNAVSINQVNRNKNTNQNANKCDKCDTCGYRHGGECMVKKGVIPKDWQGSDEARKRLQERIGQYKEKVKSMAASTTESKSKKDKVTPLVLSAVFFIQQQPIAAKMDLDQTDIQDDEDSVEAIEPPIESSDECHEWYLDSCASAHFTNNKRYFKTFRPINHHTASTVTSDLFSIEGIGTIQLEVLTQEGTKVLFQVNDVYCLPRIRMSLLSPTELFRQSGITGMWGETDNQGKTKRRWKIATGGRQRVEREQRAEEKAKSKPAEMMKGKEEKNEKTTEKGGGTGIFKQAGQRGSSPRASS